MNQHFSIRRFFRYANYNVQTNKRLLIFFLGGFSVALYVFELFLFGANRNWNSSDWTLLFFMMLGVTALLTIGHSFHYLRKQESSFRVFLLPVSTLEKFIYELLTKTVLFTALFFYFVSTYFWFGNKYTRVLI